MEGKKIITIVSEVKEDGRLYLDFGIDKISGITKLELLSIMTNSLVMSTKMVCEDLDYESQGKLITDVLDLLKNNLFDGDSFKDLDVKIKEL
jgi:hypothetical protein